MKPTISITRKKRSYREVHERDDAGYIARPTKRRSPMTLLLDVVARIKAEEEEARKQHELDKLIDEWAQLVKADHGALMCTHKANVGFAAKVETILEGTTIDEDAHSSNGSSSSSSRSEWVDNSREEEETGRKQGWPTMHWGSRTLWGSRRSSASSCTDTAETGSTTDDDD